MTYVGSGISSQDGERLRVYDSATLYGVYGAAICVDVVEITRIGGGSVVVGLG